MGFLRRFRSRDTSEPATNRPQAGEPFICAGNDSLEVVGESFYQEALRALAPSYLHERVRVSVVGVLVAEEGNQYDENAIMVKIDGSLVGYLSREDAADYRPGLGFLESAHRQPIGLPGQVVGGGTRDDGPGFLGVFLNHDRTMFGLESTQKAPPERRLRTGLSDAIARDGGDDRYDLGWIAKLTGDTPNDIRRLRSLLQERSNPLERHFLLSFLEEQLYRSKHAFASALTEYDEICLLHDSEMETIKPALLEMWGKVPFLETYRQMAIRQFRAKDFARCVWWAERGLELYGDQAAREEAVEDLRARVIKSKEKLAPKPPRPPRSRAARLVDTERLVCIRCDDTFERQRIRGRKPTKCPACQAS